MTISKEDYARAEQFLPWNVYKLIFNSQIQPHWIENTEKFWYLKTIREKKEFILVDSRRNEVKSAFDHYKLAENISKVTGKSYNREKLPFDEIDFSEGGHFIQFNIVKKRWSCNLESYQCEEIKKKEEHPSEELVSPDGKYVAFIRNYNLYVRSIANGQEIQLTKDGEPFNDYATSPESNTSTITLRRLNITRPPIAIWSPDSKKLLTHKIDQRKVKEMHLIQSAGLRNSSRPILHSYRYPLPEDEERALAQFVILNVERETKTEVIHEPQEISYLSPIESKFAWWSEDSNFAYFIHTDRGFKTVRLYEIDVHSGFTRKILEEKDSMRVDLTHFLGNKPIVWILSKSKEVIWFSQRDGWGHLYLYDGSSGSLKNQITSGNWLIHEIVHVNEDNRWVYFLAGGREINRDPYYRYLYRINLNGKDLQLLTPEDANHEVIFSPTGNYLLDNFSRVDKVPESILRASNGHLIRKLEQADIESLVATGWKWPERFSVKGRDGKTELYGVIFFPTTFNKNKKYPIVDFIYPGPQRINTPKSFHTKIDMDLLFFWDPQALAELSFIIVIVDGFGTPLRSKALLNFSYGNMGDAGGLEDHVVAIQQLAKYRPYMDINQVGIYGHSGGGFASARAMLTYPDFYKVAVSSAGNHDQRGYLADWGERYQGLLNGDNYLNQVNDKIAKNLKGNLLLACGDLDDNVPPALTFQLVDALIKANKDFDLLVLPNRNHYFLIDEYFIRKKWDYFVEHLLGEKPPKEYKIKPPKMEFILNLASQLV